MTTLCAMLAHVPADKIAPAIDRIIDAEGLATVSRWHREQRQSKGLACRRRAMIVRHALGRIALRRLSRADVAR